MKQLENRPRLYVRDLKKWTKAVEAERAITDDLYVAAIEDGIILPLRFLEDGPEYERRMAGGLVDAGGNFVAGHEVTPPPQTHAQSITTAYPLPEQIVQIDETVIFGGGRDDGRFGHFITEQLSRLWYAVQHADQNLRVAFPSAGRPERSSRLAQWLTMMGLPPERIIWVDEATQFTRVIVPEQCVYLYGGIAHLEGMRLIYDAIRAAVEPAQVEKVYLTRSDMPQPLQMREINESWLEDFFTARGYTVVAPETLSPDETVALLAGAKEVACTLGTVSHLLAFAPQGVKATVIPRHSVLNRFAEIQFPICALREANWSVVDCGLELMPCTHRSGVLYYANTPQWADYAEAEWRAEVPARPAEADVLAYLHAWLEMVAEIPADEYERWTMTQLPYWTLGDFALRLAEVLEAPQVPEAARPAFEDHFGDARILRRFDVGGSRLGDPAAARTASHWMGYGMALANRKCEKAEEELDRVRRSVSLRLGHVLIAPIRLPLLALRLLTRRRR